MDTETVAVPDVVDLNTPIPAGLRRDLKIGAAMKGITMREAVIEALEMWIENRGAA